MISVEEISRITNNRNRMKKETYVELYKQISRKVRRAVESQKRRVAFEVPAFIVGYPTYDRLKATSYLKRQLELSGFIVHITGNFEFTITWKIKRDREAQPGSIDHIEDFPTLVNLKKVANRYRRDAQ
mgnify:FL=1|jgi:hypothetical protein|tara:strand:+ start:600 stop:983 length:384 start_codon:yes stop_codon:yes gene_type:complete